MKNWYRPTLVLFPSMEEVLFFSSYTKKHIDKKKILRINDNFNEHKT